MHNWNDDWGAGHWLVMGIGMLLVWALLIAAIVVLVRSASGGPPSRRLPEPQERPVAQQRTARDILDQRYARGEIDDEEYRNRRETLASG